jgi:hypothetical protein
LHTDQYRLRLDSVQESSCDNTLRIPPYKFNYFGEQVPRRLSFGVDHWGFSNGVTNNASLVPTFTVVVNGTPTTTNGAIRDAAWPAMRGGSLQQITYPTGGFTQFNFEPKLVYNFTNAVLQNQTLASFAVHINGQSQTSQTNSFTLNSDGSCTVSIVNSSTNNSPTLTILNSSNVQVYYSGYFNVSSSSSFTLSLPAGTYQATLAYPNSPGTTINGVTGTIGQWQYVPVTTTQTVGGLRIKSITTNDGATADNMVTSYSYGGNSVSSGGTLYSIPVYVQTIRNDLMGLVWPLSTPNGCQYINGYGYYVSAGTQRPMSSLQGENVGYNEVDVTQPGNGKTVYMYYSSGIWNSTISDVCVRTIKETGTCDITVPNFPAPPLSFEFMRNELQYVGQFNQAGKALKETYSYPVYNLDPLTTPGHISVNVPGLFTYTEYQLQTAYKSQEKTISYAYDPSNNTQLSYTNITYYGSPYHHSATRTVSSTSTADSIVKNIKYAFDFRIPSCDAISDSLAYYNTAVHNDSTWMYSILSSCIPQTGDANNCRWINFIQFRSLMAQARRQFITYRRRSYAPDSINLQSACYLAATPAADTLLMPILRLQNRYINAPIESSDWKSTNLMHASFTRYDTSFSPIGFAYPGRTQLINLQATSSIFTNSAVSGNRISKDSRYVDESIYNFSKGNPMQVLSRDGVSNSFIWDYLNTQPIAKVTNAGQSDIAYTSFEADGQGNWSFTATQVADASAQTGAKVYPLSTSYPITKSGLNSNTTYVVSYWSKTGSSYSVSGSNSVKQGKTINGWTFFEHTASGNATITVSGTGSLDELRLYPSTAQMTTYTYMPLVGITSQCDIDNRISYYQYDLLGRLKLVKDQDGNIIKTIKYNYKNQVGLAY